MTFKEFSNQIHAEYSNATEGFVAGDTIREIIEKNYEDRNLRVEKSVRRTFGSGSHNNREKLLVVIQVDDAAFNKAIIKRKGIIDRLVCFSKSQFEVSCDDPEFLNKIIASEELQFLLSYPDSSISLDKNKVQFVMATRGELKCDYHTILKSLFGLIDQLV